MNKLIRYRFGDGAWIDREVEDYRLYEQQAYDNRYVCCTGVFMTKDYVEWDCGDILKLKTIDSFQGKLISANAVMIPFGGHDVFGVKVVYEDSRGRQKQKQSRINYIPDGRGQYFNARFRSIGSCYDPSEHGYKSILYLQSGSVSGFYAGDEYGNPVGSYTKYVIEFLNNGEYAGRDSARYPVEVEESNLNACPEGTCEVICGDTICCYGSDGISVSNFSRT